MHPLTSTAPRLSADARPRGELLRTQLPNRQLILLCLIVPLGMLAGCGGPDRETPVKVSGTVKCAGEALTGGIIHFRPDSTDAYPGPAATGEIQPNGSFVLTTFEQGDGAIPGKYIVSIEAPPAPAGDEDAEPIEIGCANATQSVEVKAGETNLIPIRLSDE